MKHARSTRQPARWPTLALALGFLAWLGAAATPARAACLTPTSLALLQQAMNQADEAYAQFDIEGFSQSLDTVRRVTPCLVETAPPLVVAQLHRIEGLRAFVDNKPTRARQAFAAARALDPEHRLPDAIAPQGHPLYEVYYATAMGIPQGAAVPSPATGTLMFDGKRTEERPVSWPTLFQLVGDDGSVQSTAYLWPGVPVPKYAVSTGQHKTQGALQPERSDSALATAPSLEQPGRARLPLLATAGATAGAASALYFLSSGSADTYWQMVGEPHTDPLGAQAVESQRDRTNGLFLASAGCSVVALGALTGALLVAAW